MNYGMGADDRDEALLELISCSALILSRRILAASVPSSGEAGVLNHGCWRACFAVIRCAGSYTKIFLRRSRKLARNGVWDGIKSCGWLVLASLSYSLRQCQVDLPVDASLP